YVRESRSLSASKKSMVMQERLFFRNIPLSNWIEHEMVVEEGRDLNQLPKESVFAAPALGHGNGSNGHEGRLAISKLLEEASRHPSSESGALIAARAPAFGAQ